MIAITLTIRPPAPRPCSTRKTISSVMPSWTPPNREEPAAPQSAEPTRKITIEMRKIALRPKRSPIFPQIGVDTVVPRTYAVTTHDRCARPPSSPTMRGIAVPTMKLSNIASIIAISSPGRTTSTSRRIPAGASSADAPTVSFDTAAPFPPYGTVAVANALADAIR